MAAPFIIRDNNAVAGWVFAGVWFLFLAIFSAIYLRDGGFDQFDPKMEGLILAGFWLFGVVGLLPLLLTPRTRLVVEHRRGTLLRIWLWRTRRDDIDHATLRAVQIRNDKDSDGDLRHSLILSLPSGEVIDLRISADRATIEDLHAQLMASL